MRQARTPSATSAAARLCTEMQPSPPGSMAEITATTSLCSSRAWCARSTVNSRPEALIARRVSRRCSRSSSEMPSAATMLCSVRRPSSLSMARTMATTSRCSSRAEWASSTVRASEPAATALCRASSTCCRASSERATAGFLISAAVRNPSPLASRARTMRRTSRCSSSASCASSAVSRDPSASRFSRHSQRCSRSSSGRWFAASMWSAVRVASMVRSRRLTARRQ
mmetsp:Transcript_4/g.17  ORF Transcript_4/g.17 Transcript_4/m.17 type:complete len:226 (-) Transcript_4:104-781(-)